MRRLGDAQLAEEAVQNVFLALVRKAATLASRPGLAAWLHRAAVLEASALARARSRREKRHLQFHLGSAPVITAPWPDNQSAGDSKIGLWLDEALHRLPEIDHALLLGRYLEEQSFEELARTFGKSGDAIKKRIQRALEKVAVHLRRRGAVLSEGGLASLAAAEFSPASFLSTPPVFSPPGMPSTSAAKTAALSWHHHLILIMSTPKITVTAAALLLMLLGLTGWQAAANRQLRQETLARRTLLAKEAGAGSQVRRQASPSAASRPAPLPAQPLPDPIDGLTLARIYAYSRAGEALALEPIPPNWTQDMDRHYREADTAEILRLIDEASRAPVAGSLQMKLVQDLIAYRLSDHDPGLAVRLGVEKRLHRQDLARLMSHFAGRDLEAAEKVFMEFRAASNQTVQASVRNDPAAGLMAGFGRFFEIGSKPAIIPDALLAFADRHLDSGMISDLIFGESQNPQGSPIVNALMFNPGPVLELAGRVNDAADRERIFSGLGQIHMNAQPYQISPKAGGGTFFENGELHMPVNPDPAQPERTSVVIPNVLADPRFPAALRDGVIIEGTSHRHAWAALAVVARISEPASRDENLARTAGRLTAIPARRKELETNPAPANAEDRRLMDETLADTAHALTVRQNPDLARRLADKISDPKLRDQTLRAATP